MAFGNQTNITPPRVPIIDERTNAVSREWYRWFYSVFTTLGSGTGIIPVDAGGTGLGTIPTNGQLLIGNGTGYSLNTLGTGAGISVTNGAGAVTVANTGVLSFAGGATGLTPTTATTGAVTLAGTLIAVNGGTGFASYAVGDLLYANTTTTLAKLPDVATGNALISGGVSTAPAWGKIGLTTHVSGVLPIANGGTNGSATPTTYGVAYGTGTTYAFTAAGTAKQVLIANTSAAPTWSTLTTGTSILYGDGTGGFSNVTIGSGVSFVAGTLSATGSGGTVTSVTGTSPVVSSGGATPAISLATAYGDTLNPYASKTANTILAAPSGSAGVPTFRALTTADIPALPYGTGTVTSVAALTLGTTGTDLTSTVANGTTTPVITLNVPTASASNRGALSAADWTTFNNKGSGTVTSVTGTAPVVSSGGATPAISMAAATTSVNGYLTSTDWTTFNNKAPAVTFTTNYVPFGQGTTTLNQSSVFTYNGTTLATPSVTTTNDASIHGLTVGLGAGSQADTTAVGVSALASNSTGTRTTAVGYRAGFASTGNYNSYFGSYAGQSHTGTQNSAFGDYSLVTAGTGAANNAFGQAALNSCAGGGYNTAVGVSALGSLSSGNDNVAIGYVAGGGGTPITTGNSNIYIGNYAYPSASAVGGEVVIGYGGAGKGGNTAFIASPSGAYQGNNSTLWSITSDRRIKENIVPVATGLNKILALNPVEFDYIEKRKDLEGNETTQHDIGFIAQEYQIVFPDQVKKHVANAFQKQLAGEDEIYGVQQNLVPYLVKAIQELNEKFDAYVASHP